MRCSLLVVLVALLALASSAQAQTTICDRYAAVLGAPVRPFMETLITRIVFGTQNIGSQLSAADQAANGTIVALNSTGNGLTTFSTGNFANVEKTLTFSGLTGTLVGLARRPSNGLYYFLNNAGQLYSGNVDAIINGTLPGTVVTLSTVGAAASPRGNNAAVTGNTGGVGFGFNPAADRIRIVQGNRNFRINPDTGAAGAGTSEDGTDAGGPITYNDASQGTPDLVATAYTNQVYLNGAVPSGTTQYGIDATNKRFVTFAAAVAGQPVGPNFGNITSPAPALTGIPDGTLTVNSALTVVPVGANGQNAASNVIFAILSVQTGSGVDTAAYTITTGGAATRLRSFTNAYRAVAFTPVVAGNSISQPLRVVPGIAGTANIVGFFNRGIIFKNNQPDFTSGEPLIALRDKLVNFFGQPAVLGCNGFSAVSLTNMDSVHRSMNISRSQRDAFNGQIVATAQSFGVAEADIATVGGFLALFDRQPQSTGQAICTVSTGADACPCATGFSGTDCQTASGTSSGGAAGTSTAAGGGGDPSAASGVSAPFALVAALAVAIAALRA